LFLVLFASTYFLMERASAASFTQPLTRTDALYFKAARIPGFAVFEPSKRCLPRH
jgi:hypothetical protein